MSRAIPHSVQMDSQLADRSTLFEPGQVKAIRTAMRYCQAVRLTLADYSVLLAKIDDGRVLNKKDRRRLSDVLNRHAEERLGSKERQLNAWARSAVWDAHRPSRDSSQ